MAASELSGILLDQADRLFEQHGTREVLAAADRGEWPAALWGACEEAGLPLALVPEASGGIGLSFAEVAPLIRRSAYRGTPIPLAETIGANALWAAAGGEPVSGPVTLGPTNGRDRLRLTRNRDGAATLDGSLARVPWAAEAGHALLLATGKDGKVHLCLVPRGTGRTSALRNVAGEPRETLVFEASTVPAEAVRPAPAGLSDPTLVLGAALRSLQMTGAMESCLESALGHANDRVQFGRPLAKFQAIQHMLAIAAGHVAASAAASDALGEAYGTPGFPFAVAIAKARVGEAAGQVAAICHQVHGAMGFTQDHPLHFSTRRLWAWRDEFGAESFWQARIGRLVASRGGEGLWMLVTGETAAA